MSVLIKGMKIPTHCIDCVLEEDGYCFLINDVVEPHDKSDNCPLVDVPAADVVPVAFNRFAEWVADWVLRSDFEESAGGFAELACRRLEALGIMRKDGNKWVRNEVKE